jgi:hypothetical protein
MFYVSPFRTVLFGLSLLHLAYIPSWTSWITFLTRCLSVGTYSFIARLSSVLTASLRSLSSFALTDSDIILNYMFCTP